MKHMHPRSRRLLAAAFWLVLWQLASVSVGQPILLASPLSTLARLFWLAGTAAFWRSALFTLGHILAGYALAAAAGVLLAVLAGRFSAVADLLAPLLSAMRSVPVASFVIAALIWVPSRRLSVLICFLIVLPVVYAGALDGLRQIDRQLMEMARVFRMPRLNRLRSPKRLPNRQQNLRQVPRTHLGRSAGCRGKLRQPHFLAHRSCWWSHTLCHGITSHWAFRPTA